VPESPAFTVLGVTPNAIARPGTPREFATSLLNGLDKNGNFQTGLAIDTAPYMLFNGQNVTLQDYNDYYLTRLLSRTQFSLATTKGAASDDTATRLALGLNVTLWDKGDARVYHPKRGPDGDVLTCFKANIQPPDAPSSAIRHRQRLPPSMRKRSPPITKWQMPVATKSGRRIGMRQAG
jgi:hypothetical protein